MPLDWLVSRKEEAGAARELARTIKGIRMRYVYLVFALANSITDVTLKGLAKVLRERVMDSTADRSRM